MRSKGENSAFLHVIMFNGKRSIHLISKEDHKLLLKIRH